MAEQSQSSYRGLKPLLMPSGPQWAEKWTDTVPPSLVHYDWHHYHVSWRDSVRDRVREWPDGAWVCEPDPPPGWVRVLLRLGRYVPPGTYGTACEHRWSCAPPRHWWQQQPTCVTMTWRFAIGPDLKPWVSGDEQGQDGHWPISIAVFGSEQVRSADVASARR